MLLQQRLGKFEVRGAVNFLPLLPCGPLLKLPRLVGEHSLLLTVLLSLRPLNQQLIPQIVPRWQRGIERLRLHTERQIYDPELEIYRWMSEELRVALFTQELGTAVSVSEKKLDKQWEKVRA